MIKIKIDCPVATEIDEQVVANSIASYLGRTTEATVLIATETGYDTPRLTPENFFLPVGTVVILLAK